MGAVLSETCAAPCEAAEAPVLEREVAIDSEGGAEWGGG